MHKESIATIARRIIEDWKKPYFGAVPYIKAMSTMNHISDKYLFEDGADIVLRFLANAQNWRGPIAREVKAELNRRLKEAQN